MAGREVLKLGLRYQVGDGMNILIWNDPWVPQPHSFKPYSPMMEGTEDYKVGDLIDQETKKWEVEFMRHLFTDGEINQIASIPLSWRGGEDLAL